MSTLIDRSTLRGADVLEALKGEVPVARQQFVFVCAWCPTSYERTTALRALGLQSSHGICPDCTAKLLAEMEADRERRV